MASYPAVTIEFTDADMDRIWRLAMVHMSRDPKLLIDKALSYATGLYVVVLTEAGKAEGFELDDCPVVSLHRSPAGRWTYHQAELRDGGDPPVALVPAPPGRGGGPGPRRGG